MMVLLLFNQSSQWTVEQIQTNTELDLQLLRTIFSHLIEAKILISHENRMNINSTLRLTDDFRR